MMKDAAPDHADERRYVKWRSALREAVRPPSLRRSMIAACVVGTTLTIANLGGRLQDGPLSFGLAIKVFLTYAVPWGNATIGIAIGLRERRCSAFETGSRDRSGIQ